MPSQPELDSHHNPADGVLGDAPAHVDRALRLLLVEDSVDDAFLIERHLRKNGFLPETTRVETSFEMSTALEGELPPDVILADYNLPNFSGPAALSLLKKAELDIPFIMMSGAISEETAVESMRAGAQDYVTKQNLARLVPVLHRELREAAARRTRLAAELALVASEARFLRLVEAMPIGLLISDATGRITFANHAIEHILGYPHGTMSSGVLERSAILPSLDSLPIADVPHEPVSPHETRVLARDGQRLDALVGLTPLNPESAADARLTAAFIVDLTLQKRSEEILRRTEKLTVAGRLAASIAHEINNPLEAITNCLYLVGQTELTPDGATYLALAQSELNRVAQITVQTLRFYRRSTSTGATDLHELLETVLTLLDSRLRRSQIVIDRRFGNIPPIIAHDGELRQVFANLIGNAIDAVGADGRILIRTRASHDWTTGRAGIRIAVVDNGTGMSPENAQPHLRALLLHQGHYRYRSRPLDLPRHSRKARGHPSSAQPCRNRDASRRHHLHHLHPAPARGVVSHRRVARVALGGAPAG